MTASSMKMEYYLQLDEGIAMPKQGGCASVAAKWLTRVSGKRMGIFEYKFLPNTQIVHLVKFLIWRKIDHFAK